MIFKTVLIFVTIFQGILPSSSLNPIHPLDDSTNSTSSTTTPASTTLNPISKDELIHLFNDTVQKINSTYNLSVSLLASRTKETTEMVESLLLNLTSQIDDYVDSKQSVIVSIRKQADNQGTFRDHCEDFVDKINNVSESFRPDINTCVNELSNKVQAYWALQNFSLTESLTYFGKDIQDALMDCNETDHYCLNYVLGEVQNTKAFVLNYFKLENADIDAKYEEFQKSLDKCQMLKEAKAAIEVYLNELADCCDVNIVKMEEQLTKGVLAESSLSNLRTDNKLETA